MKQFMVAKKLSGLGMKITKLKIVYGLQKEAYIKVKRLQPLI